LLISKSLIQSAALVKSDKMFGSISNFGWT